MRTRVRNWWEALRATFWVVPALMTLMAVAMSFTLIALDEAVRDKVIGHLGWVWAGGPEGARGLLSTVAGSMITVAGVVFSITIVALSLASSQFGPRLLRNFMRDTGNQIVLGTFIATYVYCILVLRTVRSNGAQEFVPSIAITGGVVLALVSLGVLIYFIHHVSASMQVTRLITIVSRDLLDAIDRIFPEALGHDAAPSLTPHEVPRAQSFRGEALAVDATRSGYLQAIDSDSLMQLATVHDLVLHVKHRPGHFVVQGSELLTIWSEGTVDEGLAEQLRGAFILGAERTLTQDAEFGMDQLVEVAVRALSPGINDPFTAITCIDRLGEALSHLAERTLPAPSRYDDDGRLRVVAHPITFTGMCDAAFNPIRQYGRGSVAVTIRLLEVIAGIAEHTFREEDRAALLQQARMIERSSQAAIPEERDREDVETRYRAVEQALLQDASRRPNRVG